MKTLSTAAAVLSLAFAGAVSAAPAPVSFSFENSHIKTVAGRPGAFSDVFEMTLSGPATVGGSLITFTTDDFAAVDIQSAYLKLGSTVLNLTPVGAGISPDDDIFGTETWTFNPQLLSAGAWELHVAGLGFGIKDFEGYTVNLTANAVELPEPTALALAALALAGLSLSRRRAR